MDSKTFSLDLSKGHDMKGIKISNLADPVNITGGSIKRYIDTKTNNFFENCWFQSNDWQSQYK